MIRNRLTSRTRKYLGGTSLAFAALLLGVSAVAPLASSASASAYSAGAGDSLAANIVNAPGDPMPGNMTMQEQLPPTMLADIQRIGSLKGEMLEQEFMSMMIHHHQSGVDMAQLALTRAKHQEVKDAAQKIIADQSRERDQLTAWLKQWYNMDPMPPSPEMMQQTQQDMAKLQSLTGDEFDMEWLMMFRMHHTMAIDSATFVRDGAIHSELRDVANNIITTQSAERRDFVAWLQSWYGMSMPEVPSNSITVTSSGGVGMPRTGSSGSGGQNMMFTAMLALVAAVVLLSVGAWARKRA